MTTRPRFVRELAAARSHFDRLNARGVVRERAADPHRTLERFRAVCGRTTSAPAPRATRLVEVFVHGKGIRRPLGIRHDYPPTHVATALRCQVRTSTRVGGVARRRRRHRRSRR